jgi:hypothetical protein
MNTTILKKIYPHLAAVGFFLLLTVVYFSPIVFDSKDLFQGDMLGVEGMAKASNDFHKQTGEYTLWSPNMFSGMPEIVTGPPTKNIFSPVSKLMRAGMPLLHMGMFFAYLIGFYIFMLCMGINIWMAVLGALAYALASYNIIIIEAGHVTKGYAMAWIAPILGGIILAFRKKILWGAIVTLIFLGLEIYANHVQITYYAMLMVILAGISYLVYYLIVEKNLALFSKITGVLCISALLACLPSTDIMLPMQDYSKDTMRGGSELTIKSDG